MPQTGTLLRWNDDRGFGFIAPADGGPDVFVHINAFPRDGSRPTIGETVTYDLGRGKDGKPQALRVVRTAVGRREPTGRAAAPHPHRRAGSSSWPRTVVLVALVVGVGAFAVQRFMGYQQRAALRQAAPTEPATEPAPPLDVASPYRCDGRIRCSEMSSCAEATWFINHCPGTEMDGDRDGVPCETQWCTGLGAP